MLIDMKVWLNHHHAFVQCINLLNIIKTIEMTEVCILSTMCVKNICNSWTCNIKYSKTSVKMCFAHKKFNIYNGLLCEKKKRKRSNIDTRIN